MCEPGSHAAGPRKARHDPKLDRGRHLNEDDRDRAGRPLQVEDGRPVGYQQIRRQPDQLSGVLAGASGLATKPAHVEPNVAPFDPAELSQPLRQCRDAGSSLLVRNRGHEHADAPDAIALCARRERPRDCRAAEKRDELAPFHSMSSSASNWSELGTWMPSVLAVCMLITNSNLVDCKTGRSAGFAPLRI